VVEDQRLLELSMQRMQGAIQEEEGVAPEPGRETSHRRGGASQGARELAVGGSSLQPCGDAGQEFRALEIVSKRKSPA
jgi:hypothetical protein